MTLSVDITHVVFCIRCEFIDEKGADELMELVSMLAGQEMARCKNSCGKGTE